MHEYRCTLPDRYPEGSLGYKDRSVRNGHYVLAENAQTAVKTLAKDFPQERIEIQYWRAGIGTDSAHAREELLGTWFPTRPIRWQPK